MWLKVLWNNVEASIYCCAGRKVVLLHFRSKKKKIAFIHPDEDCSVCVLIPTWSLKYLRPHFSGSSSKINVYKIKVDDANLYLSSTPAEGGRVLCYASAAASHVDLLTSVSW